MSESKEKDKQSVFALSKDADDNIVLVLGIPEPCWTMHLSKGLTNNFDLTKVGLKLKVLLFGDKSRAHVLDKIKASVAGNIKEDTETDYSLPENEQAVVHTRNAAMNYLENNGIIIEPDEADELIKAILTATGEGS